MHKQCVPGPLLSFVGPQAEEKDGHQYVHCTDTCNWDQNLIGPILGP